MIYSTLPDLMSQLVFYLTTLAQLASVAHYKYCIARDHTFLFLNGLDFSTHDLFCLY